MRPLLLGAEPVKTVTCPTVPGRSGVGRNYTGCGSEIRDKRDSEGLVDCRRCGLFFDPDDSSRRGRDRFASQGWTDGEIALAGVAGFLLVVGAAAGAGLAGAIHWLSK